MTTPIEIAMDDIVIKINNFLQQFGPAAQDEFDGIKLLERKVYERVGASSMLVGEGKLELALKEAEEATRVLASLKTVVLKNQQQRSASRPDSSMSSNIDTDKRSTVATSGHNDHRQPMTKAVNLFDLSIMVKCNLAARLRNNGQLESSLELYTQLCKMAIDQAGGSGSNSSSSFISEPNGNQQQLQQYKYLLHRFGLNIGNILYEMNEYQRALKYYRLTLDRLSSLAGNRNLQIKLMNNITIALMAMNGILSSGDELLTVVQPKEIKPTGAFGGLSKSNDHITSLQILLNDNSYEPVAKQQASAKQVGDLKNYSMRQIFNSHHHGFGLNLVVCQYKKFDLTSIYSTLRSLVRVDACGFHYKRVLNFDKFTCHDNSKEHGHGGRALSHNKSSFSETNKLLLDEIIVQTQSAHATNANLSSDVRKELGSPETGVAVGGELFQDDPMDRNTLRNATSNCVTSASDEPLGQVMSCAQVDELERLICAKELEIHKTLARSCSLVIDLDRSRTSALSQCSKLVATSDLYRALREELWFDSISRLLLATRANSMNTGLCLLEQIGSNQQVGAVVVGSPATSVDSSTSKSQRLAQATGRADGGGGNFKSSPPQSVQCKSPLVATNLGLLYLLRKRVDTALRMNGQALLLDRSNFESLVNMANCQMELNESQRAERIYALALELRPDCWVAYFNSLLVSIKLGHHPDDIRDLLSKISKLLNTDRVLRQQAPSRFTKVKMALTQLTLMALYKKFGMMQKSNSNLGELLADGRGPELSPEICLLASRLTSTNELDTGQDSAESTREPITILQQTLRFHPYHLPTAERLIALYISEFNYTNAIQILEDCIKNRPDQVKWYQMLAECHRRGANYNESIRIYKHAMDTFPMSESCVKALAKLADELGLEEERVACKIRLQQLSKA